MDERKKSEKMKEKKGETKKPTENNETCFSGCLFFCEKKVKGERINKEYQEKFQNKNDYFAHK